MGMMERITGGLGPRRRASLVVFALVVQLGSSSTVMAKAPSSSRAPAVAGSSALGLEVEVDDGIVEATELRQWVEDEARDVLNDLPRSPRREGKLRVEIGGALYDYRIMITALRDGDPVGAVDSWACECTTEELLGRMRDKVETAADRLEVVDAEPAGDETVAPVPVVSETADERRKRRLGPGGIAGVVLASVGGSAIAAGTALWLIPEAKTPLDEEQYTIGQLSLRVPGAAIAGLGAGLVVAGVALLLARPRSSAQRRAKATAVTPSLGPRGRLHLGITGRF